MLVKILRNEAKWCRKKNCWYNSAPQSNQIFSEKKNITVGRAQQKHVETYKNSVTKLFTITINTHFRMVRLHIRHFIVPFFYLGVFHLAVVYEHAKIMDLKCTHLRLPVEIWTNQPTNWRIYLQNGRK